MAFTALQNHSGTVATAGTPVTVTFGDNTANIPIRYSYVAVTNTSANDLLFVRADGTAAGNSGADAGIAIEINQTLVIANGAPLWTQAANVIPNGTVAGIKPGTPSENSPYGSSIYGGKASPGTSVSINTSTNGATFNVSGIG